MCIFSIDFVILFVDGILNNCRFSIQIQASFRLFVIINLRLCIFSIDFVILLFVDGILDNCRSFIRLLIQIHASFYLFVRECKI